MKSIKLLLCVLVLSSFLAYADNEDNMTLPKLPNGISEDTQTNTQDNTQVQVASVEQDDDEALEKAFQDAQEQIRQNEELQSWEMPKKEKIKDPRTLNEKVRKKLHLPKTRKIYYHNLDLSKQPRYQNDYLLMAKDIKRSEFKIPEPEYNKKPGWVIPDPHYRVIFFNSPPGARNIELHNLYNNLKADSQGILSPDKQKMVYTTVYYYPKHHQTGYDAHVTNVKAGRSIPDILKKTYITEQDMNPIVSTINDGLEEYKLSTLFPLDWSKDSKKIAFKEQIGSTVDGVWETNVIVYDFETQTTYKLDTLREAVIYYWKKVGVDLTTYMWDLYPLGWSAEDENRIVFYAYAFSTTKPFFLGTWSIDFKETKSTLISVDETSVPVSTNGYGIQLIQLSY